MSKCKVCHVEIKDESSICPLCHNVIEQKEDSENFYPDVRVFTRKMRMVSNVFLLVMIIIAAVVTYINYEYIRGMWWSFIVDAALLYVYLILRFLVLGNSGYRTKMLWMTLISIMYLILVDWVTGYRGWALNFVLPGGILALDLGIFVLMFVNFRNWQSYLPLQIWMTVCSLVPMLFCALHWITIPILSVVAFGVSLFLFLGTLIIGDRRARTELKRRFHI
ncbi:MAG: DUF6320 domain-containing protein [Lachnospiraceae bacterium]|nr:DUF6320 domain-containing protein [Lachnospiraceae bacterium]